jgi:uncharacterized protein (UPF0333 family)
MKKRGGKGQSSIEMLIILGFVVVILVPLIAIYYSQAKDATEQIIMHQADRIAKQVTDNAETVYYLGAPSKTTLHVYMPEKVENISIANNELVFTIRVGDLTSEVVQGCDVNITGTIANHPGIHVIVIEAKGGYVSITG